MLSDKGKRSCETCIHMKVMPGLFGTRSYHYCKLHSKNGEEFRISSLNYYCSEYEWTDAPSRR